MRFVTRFLVGAGVATLLAMGAPVAANASTATPATPVQATSTATTPVVFHDTWGPYSSSNHKAEAKGEVTVHKKSYKQWYWKKYSKWVKKCKWVNGHKKCKWVKIVVKKKVWKWVHEYPFTVDSKLINHKWWGKWKFHCAWETFKIVKFDNSTHFVSFKNCTQHAKFYTFHGKDAKAIYVQVSRGNPHGPKGYFGGWQSVYSQV
ncbi:hypothetical protein [Planobispora longispora]|uniref:Uncharacterized protein n=1 Tax=Planobispora longispora TaxID=28887 RepID=A0A8J3RFB0_9ACTN|nr:hypothetical protein [Planobispora longispora]BFE77782.1 hypothetical protein GCM10020093_003830 [Planobispora longispora]GIH73784.1 hypothetical protein Plo01_02130 [Planobispora longispora]